MKVAGGHLAFLEVSCKPFVEQFVFQFVKQLVPLPVPVKLISRRVNQLRIEVLKGSDAFPGMGEPRNTNAKMRA